MLKFLFILIFIIPKFSLAQYHYTGHIIDSVTQEPLAFVSMKIMNTNFGTITDIDGKYSLHSDKPNPKITLSYLGYTSKNTTLQSTTYILATTTLDLSEIVILPSENPAHIIIKNVIAHKKINNPTQIPYFTCNTYNKFWGTSDNKIPIDSLVKGKGMFTINSKCNFVVTDI